MRPVQRFQATISTKKGFYIGDLCYAMKEEIYDKVWGNMYQYEDGAFEVPEYHTSFIVCGTAHGDGYYPSASDIYYPVDAGIIGICPLELCDDAVIDRLSITGFGRITDDKGTFEVELVRDVNGAIIISIDDEIIETVYTDGRSFEDEDDDLLGY